MDHQDTPFNLHQRAMEFAYQAYIARKRGDTARAVNLAREALQIEIKAAEKLPPLAESEPTRSILYRGAASLAYQAKEFQLALKLIREGQTPYAPEEILADLEILHQDVRLAFYLQEIGLTLSNEEALIYLRGQATGYGTIVYKEFTHRLKAVITLIERTFERLSLRDYRRSGHAASQFFEPMIATAPPGSFAFKLQLAINEASQASLLVDPQSIIGEIVTNIEIATIYGVDELKKRFYAQTKNEEQANSYLLNFMATTKQFAPDGKCIEQAGITTAKHQILLTPAQSKTIQENLQFVMSEEKTSSGQPIDIIGELDRADKRENQIGITEEKTQKRYTVEIQEGLEDVVRSYFGERVRIKGTLIKSKIFLQDIEPSDES